MPGVYSAGVSRLLRRVETIVPRRAAGFGGKARNLAALARAGFPVPAAYALKGEAAASFFEAQLASEEQPGALLRNGSPPAERLAAIADTVRRAPLPPKLARDLREAFRALRADGAEAVAVRSSSTREDTAQASAAGLFRTVLNVRDEAALEAAVKECWASVFEPRVLVYLQHIGGELDVRSGLVGVVLQAMVPAETAGVLFTQNPLTGDAGEVVINAGYGLGSSVVDGRVSPDTVRLDKATSLPRDQVLGAKALRVVLGEQGVLEEEVPAALQDRLCIDELTVERLGALALQVEEHFGGPQDVEWAVHQGQVFLLQSRPITAAPQPGTRRWQKKERRDRRSIVWSNVNVGEALPGVATPLTWSVLSSFSELGFRRAFGSLGCSVPREAELVGCFRGRIYLNLSEFMAIASQVPGMRPEVLLALGGGSGAEELREGLESRSSLGFLARLPLSVSRFSRENFRVREHLAEFDEIFAAEKARISGMDPRLLSPTALGRLLSDTEGLLDRTGAIMLTVYGNLLLSAVLFQGALKLFAGDEAEALQSELLTGLADLDSAAPGISLWHIGQMLQEDAAAAAWVSEHDATSLRLDAMPEGPTRRALERFLAAHGHRGTREAEIAAPRWKEDPTLLWATLRIHASGGRGEAPVDLERRQRAVREAAEARLMKRVPLGLRPALRHLLFLLQRFMRLRERLRGQVVEVLGLFRSIALDASRRLATLNPGAGDDAAFFLTLEELHRLLRGERFSVAARVEQRRRQFERDRALPDPPNTFVGYPPPVAEATTSAGQDEFRGLPASNGIYEGKVRVLQEAAQAGSFEAGEILVAGSADVGWGPLFLVAGAVVTELGGPLSHAAIVLREYGVPAVVNAKGCLRGLQTGDRIRVDGGAGTIEVLERAAGEAS